MTIKAVFRVQCDGPCKGWLSLRESYVPGTDIQPEDHVVEPTAVRACNWPGERAARTAAQNNGWYVSSAQGGPRALCPECKTNPLGITLPPDPCSECGHAHRKGEICQRLIGSETICACDGEPVVPDPLCVCTHPMSEHNMNGLCITLTRDPCLECGHAHRKGEICQRLIGSETICACDGEHSRGCGHATVHGGES